MRYFWMCLVSLCVSVAPVGATTYYVATTGLDTNPGTEANPLRTITQCKNMAYAGDTCLIAPGSYYERIVTIRGGTSGPDGIPRTADDLRLIYKANGGTVTMRGFSVYHPYVTIQGFDITDPGTSAAGRGAIKFTANADYFDCLDNTVRDMPYIPRSAGYMGIEVGPPAADYADYGIIKGNTVTRTSYFMLQLGGGHHLVTDNVFEHLGGLDDFVRLNGHSIIIRRNIFRYIQDGSNGHNDLMQTFGGAGTECKDILFEENWVQNLSNDIPTGYLAQMTSGSGNVYIADISPDVRDVTIRRNVMYNVAKGGSMLLPGITLENNTFYECAWESGGYTFTGSLTSGRITNTTIKNNVFLSCGSSELSSAGQDGFYSYQDYLMGPRTVNATVTFETTSSDNPIPIASAIVSDLLENGFLLPNYFLSPTTYAMTSIDDFTLEEFAEYKQATYDALMLSVAYANEDRASAKIDYNFVAGSPLAGYPGKAVSGCVPGVPKAMRFCELHGINGGNPYLTDLTNPLGPDGIPFTVDDGLKPVAGSGRLCGKGEGGVDIGAYSCQAGVVFSGKFAQPTNVIVREP
jgi:hypothetical protein